MLYNPNEHIVIRPNPIIEGTIVCDKLHPQGRVEQLATMDGTNINKAFATFANEGIIEPKGYYIIKNLNDKPTTYYYGNYK